MKLTAKKFSVKDFLVKYALFLLIFALWIFYGTNSPHFFSLKNLYSRADVFGLDLYEVGLGEQIEGMVAELYAGPGAVRRTLHKYVSAR